MKIIKLNKLTNYKNEDNRVVALGLFETMHKGHKLIIERAITLAQTNNIKSTIVTVSNSVNKKGLPTFDINHRIAMIKKLGADELIIIDMNETVQNSSSSLFIELLQAINTKVIVSGSDYRFGHLGSGDVELLKQNFTVDVVSFVLEDGEKVSTTKIKSYLASGKIKHANNLLGYNYYIKGTVELGKQLGRQLGVPTANVYPKISPLATGVYLTKTTVMNNHYRSITNIGYNPTTGDDRLSIETYIGEGFDFDIYGHEIKVEMIEKIRDEVKFDSLDELVARLKLDIKYMEEASYENS